MKGRTKFFNYFIACIATLSLATFAACSDDDPETEVHPKYWTD